MASTLTPTDRRRLQQIDARLERTGEPLEAGDTGPAARALENTLTQLGFTPGTVDAELDGHSRGTVKNFQQAMGLEVTGKVDEKTLSALRDALTRERAAPGAVRRGQKGDDVATVERQLHLLGYDSGKRDGIADGELAGAIREFKRDQGQFDNRASMLSKKGQAILGREAAGMKHAVQHGRADLTAEQKHRDRALAELSHRHNADGSIGVGEGARRNALSQLQVRLRKAGFDPKRTDGVFDERTRGALEAFQRKSGIDATGRLDPATWKKLQGTIIDTDQPASPAQRVNERSGAVMHTEKLLRRAGFNPGKVDGLYTKRTAKAVRQFERELHRKVDGRLGPKNLAALKKLAHSPFHKPSNDYKVQAWRGVKANGRTIEMVAQAERWARQHGVAGGWLMYQGGYNAGGVGASEGTHDGGGALDVNTTGKSAHTIHVMVEAMRRAGFAAWHRPAGTVAPQDHIHAIAIGDRDMSSEARGQVIEYFNDGDGLEGSGSDPHSGIGRPIPAWARRWARKFS